MEGRRKDAVPHSIGIRNHIEKETLSAHRGTTQRDHIGVRPHEIPIRLDAKYPEGDKIRLILDNHSAHTSQETQRYLNNHLGRFEFVFTPTHGSWLNLVEGFFSKLTKQMLQGIDSSDVLCLQDDLWMVFLKCTPGI